MIRLTIDDREVTVPEGTMVADAAAKLGIEIPVYCYHEALGPLGACRICLVAVDKAPKLMTACTTAVQEGMVVHTRGSAVDKGRQGVLEFLLINHPLDCPVCDKGAECFLQDYAFRYGAPAGRYDEPKIHKLKDAPINEFIMLDQERCVLCQRCVRFLSEYVGEEQLLLEGRGVETVVAAVGHQPVDSPFSGNVIDLCPVGALLSIPYRYKARPWNQERVESVCPHCPVGCTALVTGRDGYVVRVEGRPEADRHWGWLCDRGHFGYDFGYLPNRLVAATVEGEERSAAEAQRTVGGWIAQAVANHGPESVAILVGGQHTVEEANQIVRFAREVLGTERVAMVRSTRGYLPSGLNGTFEDIERADTVVYLGGDPYESVPVVHLKLRDRYRQFPDLKVIGIGAWMLTRPTLPGLNVVVEPGQEAAVVAAALNAAAGEQEAVKTLTAKLGGWRPSLAGVDPAAVQDQLQELGQSLLASEHLVLLWDGKDPEMESVLLTIKAIREERTAVLPMFGPANWRGFERAGIDPRFDRLDSVLDDCIAGRVTTLLVFGGDLLREYPDRRRAEEALTSVERVVQEGLFAPEGQEHYHAVVPGAGWGEVIGTYVNMEGRSQAAQAPAIPPGQARPVRTYLLAWAHALKKNLVFDEDGSGPGKVAADMPGGDSRGAIAPVTRPESRAQTGDELVVIGAARVMEGGLPSEFLAPRVAKDLPGRLSMEDARRLEIGQAGQLWIEGAGDTLLVNAAPDPRVPAGRLVLAVGVGESPLNRIGDGATVRATRREEVKTR